MPLELEPGEKFAYNNTAYVLFGAVIEKASGQSYESYLRQNSFEPLGMADSVTTPPAPSSHADHLDMFRPYAAGSLYSTGDDLLKWNQAHGGGINCITIAILSNQSNPAPERIANAFGRMAFGETVEPRPLVTRVEVPTGKLDQLAGHYELSPTSDSTLVQMAIDAKLEFNRGPEDPATSLTLHQGGEP